MRGAGLLLICGAGLLRICGAGLLLTCGAGLLLTAGALFLSNPELLAGVLFSLGSADLVLPGFVLITLLSVLPRVITDGCLTSVLPLLTLDGVLPLLVEKLLSLSEPLLRTSLAVLFLTVLVLARVEISLVPFALRLPCAVSRAPVDLSPVCVASALVVPVPLVPIAWPREATLDCSSACLLDTLVRCAKLLLGFCLSYALDLRELYIATARLLLLTFT